MNDDCDIDRLLRREGKNRIFRARGKFNQAGVFSHITQRAAGSEPLFLEDDDYLCMLGLIKETSKKFDLIFYALCLMPNHVHLLLKTSNANLSQAMHSIFARYGMYFNRKYARRGHIFGSAYRQAVCLDNSYFLTASVYIHLNPVRAGLAQKAHDYRWSSCNLYCSENPPPSFVQPDFALALIDPDWECARKLYAELLEKGNDCQPENILEKETAIEKLVSSLSDLFPRLFKQTEEVGKKSAEGNGLLDQVRLEEMIREARFWHPRLAKTDKARRYLVEQLVARGYKKSEIAELFGITRKTVYNILN
jgi:putative transposase